MLCVVNLQILLVMFSGISEATTIVEDLDNEDEMLRASTNFRYELGFVLSPLNSRTQDLLL
jgi:hypothetical protein